MMTAIHRCSICKEPIEVQGTDPNLSALEHLSAVHGIVVPAKKRDYNSVEEKRIDDELTRHLEEIRFSKVNN